MSTGFFYIKRVCTKGASLNCIKIIEDKYNSQFVSWTWDIFNDTFSLEGKGIQKEHVHLVIELMKYEEQKKQKIINQNMVGVIVYFSLIWLHNQFSVFYFVHRVDILLALLQFMGIVCMGEIFYFNNQKQKYTENEIKVFLGMNQKEGMKTSGEMLQYAKRNQKAELKQYEKGFQAIEEKL